MFHLPEGVDDLWAASGHRLGGILHTFILHHLPTGGNAEGEQFLAHARKRNYRVYHVVCICYRVSIAWLLRGYCVVDT